MAEERRRLAAVLAADVVGYSRLMEQDESDTLATLKARWKEILEPLIARHQGRIFKFTGDGVLVELVVQSMPCNAPSSCSAAWPPQTPICRTLATWCCASE
jgi:adenylate cyclase